MMNRRRDYPIIRFLIGSFYLLALLALGGGLVMAGYMWVRAEALQDGKYIGGFLSGPLNKFSSNDLTLAAAAAAGVGLIIFLLFGAIGQFLAMQRDRAIGSLLQVQLLEDILELNEEVGDPADTPRVDRCDGCGRLGALHKIDSGQAVCRECRQQLRTG